MLYTPLSLKTLLFAVLTLGVALMGAPAAQAQSADAEDEIRSTLEERDRKIKTVLGTSGALTAPQEEELKTLINGVVDFRAMSRTALGPFWKDLSAAQRTEFVDVFSTIVRAQSLSNLEPYRADVTYDEIDVSDGAAHVTTSTVYQGEPITVEYDLQKANGGWRAHDIIIDEVSTVGGYERSFQTYMRKKGFDALMQSLRKKRDKVVS